MSAPRSSEASAVVAIVAAAAISLFCFAVADLAAQVLR
jgi:hypothetical protein